MICLGAGSPIRQDSHEQLPCSKSRNRPELHTTSNGYFQSISLTRHCMLTIQSYLCSILLSTVLFVLFSNNILTTAQTVQQGATPPYAADLWCISNQQWLQHTQSHQIPIHSQHQDGHHAHHKRSPNITFRKKTKNRKGSSQRKGDSGKEQNSSVTTIDTQSEHMNTNRPWDRCRHTTSFKNHSPKKDFQDRGKVHLRYAGASTSAQHDAEDN